MFDECQDNDSKKEILDKMIEVEKLELLRLQQATEQLRLQQTPEQLRLQLELEKARANKSEGTTYYYYILINKSHNY